MHIINTGGTFNKRYNQIDGSLYVPKDNEAVDSILKHLNININVIGCIFKDSLEISDKDRHQLVELISSIDSENIIIIHGTDTMCKSANYVHKRFKNKNIIFTGAMKPYEIDNIEGIINLSMCIGFLSKINTNGVYICMSGIIKKHNEIYKDKKNSVFLGK
jgi:L-asparaginase